MQHLQKGKILNALAKYLLNADSPVRGYLEFNRWAETHMTAESNRIIMTDLIDKRNDAVLHYLNRALDRYDIFVIPWGALHMRGLEQAILEIGFLPVTTRERLSIDFLLLPYGEIWNKLTQN